MPRRLRGPAKYWAEYRARYHSALPNYRLYIPGKPGFFRRGARALQCMGGSATTQDNQGTKDVLWISVLINKNGVYAPNDGTIFCARKNVFGVPKNT